MRAEYAHYHIVMEWVVREDGRYKRNYASEYTFTEYMSMWSALGLALFLDGGISRMELNSTKKIRSHLFGAILVVTEPMEPKEKVGE